MYNFTAIEHQSKIVDDNEFFTQYLSEAYPWRYDSNFFLLKFQPVLQEFKLIEEMQYVSHKELAMDHLKFYWPMNTALTDPITRYLDENDYGLELLELYYLKPGNFRMKAGAIDLTIEEVTPETIGAFKSFNYPHDKEIGSDFANYKLGFYEDLLEDNQCTFYTALFNGRIIASLVSYENEDTIEIDDVIVHKDMRYKGVARQLIERVAADAEDKEKDLILVADGEDTVGNMYQKLGFQQSGSLIAATKILN